MRKIIIISFILIAIIASNCINGTGKNSADSTSKSGFSGKSEIIFREYQHDFGKVAEGEKSVVHSHLIIKEQKILLSLQQLQHVDAPFQNMIKNQFVLEPVEIWMWFLTLREETECKQKPLP